MRGCLENGALSLLRNQVVLLFFSQPPLSASPVYSTNQFQRVHPVSPIIGVEELLATDGDKVNLFPLLMRVSRLSVYAGRNQDIPYRHT